MQFNRCFGCMKEMQDYPCPHCGFDPAQTTALNYVLPCGTILDGHYVVGKKLGQGGFGITYIGFDLVLQRKVAIKEYFPRGLVTRITATNTDVQWLDREQENQIREDGMRSVLREARKMAKIEDIPEVVRVLDCFQENKTAYIVMDYVNGKTLMSTLEEQGPMSWERAKTIFLPAIAAMETLHREGVVHRDISPDNLMLTKKGVRILDLGAAKDLGINNGASSVRVVKRGFSPLEQYTQQGGSGPWTDVYAMAATMYYSLTGILPPISLDRLEEDTMDWMLLKNRGVPKQVIVALQNAMKLTAKTRTQSMAEFLRQLRSQPAPGREPKGIIVGCIAAVCALVIGIGILSGRKKVTSPEPVVISAETSVPLEAENATQVQAESEETISPINPGTVVEFGRYEQDNNEKNGAETIEWLVLDVQGNKVLILSQYALDAKPYHQNYGQITWEKCSLRNWLNSAFLESAFSDEERNAILITDVDNSSSQGNEKWNIESQNSTLDRVFLLSYAEAECYFVNANSRVCKPTEYAVSNGAEPRTLDDGATASCWWLRSPGESKFQASFVEFHGTRYANNVGNGYIAIRPAIWIDISNDVFI